MRRRALKRLLVFCTKLYPISIASLPITTFSSGSVSAVYENDVRGIHKGTDRGFEQINVLLYYTIGDAAQRSLVISFYLMFYSTASAPASSPLLFALTETSNLGLTFGLLRGRIGYSRHSGCCCYCCLGRYFYCGRIKPTLFSGTEIRSTAFDISGTAITLSPLEQSATVHQRPVEALARSGKSSRQLTPSHWGWLQLFPFI